MFQQVIKNFNIHFNPLNEQNTISGGDLVTGHISFELTKETKITSITMAVRGKAHVHWSRGGGGKRSRRRHYSAKLEFFNLQGYIMQDGNVSGGTTKLQPGTHMFPFSCQLPQGDFPSTFHGPHGHIAYTLTVGINRPWHLCKDFVAQLNFVNRFDTNQPLLGAPLSGSNSKTVCCLCCVSGPVTMTVSTEKKAFTPGETLKLICDFSNASTRTITPKIKLQQRQVYYTISRNSRTMVFKKLEFITGHPINPHTSFVRNEILLTIPTSASPSISNCSILEVEYFIEVRLCASFSSDLTVLIPIIICNTFISPQPPAYM
ncbi:arrestin domain-containing protein 3-like [Cheilinus undulatus]|uniref:arrestin domain-containing protein 3-like n=1 Tax=Cheilinus undulatus TaxID=241271 RepID=UPI001BD4F4D4|nr:arrestin domain-containing protein 3-like [Cheilinus undulatus]